MKKYSIKISRHSIVSTVLKINARNKYDAIEKALRDARLQKVKWKDEGTIIRHDTDLMEL